MEQCWKQLKIGDRWISIGGISETGVKKKENQDAFRIGVDCKKQIAYIIVADGLGSCMYSSQGANKIADIIEMWIMNSLPEFDSLSDSIAEEMIGRVIFEWKASYDSSYIREYDTTFHVALLYKGSLLIGGIGDGMALVSYDKFPCKDYISTHKGFSNITESICSVGSMEEVSHEIITSDSIKNRAIVIISTDGISDDLIPEKMNTLPAYFMEAIRANGIASFHLELEDWISDWQTENHSDDKTLCYLMIEMETV